MSTVLPAAVTIRALDVAVWWGLPQELPCSLASSPIYLVIKNEICSGL